MANPNVEVTVSFVTQLGESLRVPDSPISVPGKLGRYGLSEVVNHLLGNSHPVPFDFLTANKVLLRSSLSEYMFEYGVSSEGVLVLEYILAVKKPDHQADYEQDDWISSVCSVPSTQFCFAGLYSGAVALVDASSDAADQDKAQFEAHEEAVTDVCVVRSQDRTRVVTASKDHSVKVWDVPSKSIRTAPVLAGTLTGHTGAVEAVAYSASQSLLCSASWDATLKLWELPDSASAPAQSSKKRKTSKQKAGQAETEGAAASAVAAAGTLSGHTQVVSCVAWSGSTVLSGSWDYSVRAWDPESCACVRTFDGQKAVQCIAVPPASSYLSSGFATGHGDAMIRVWDIRDVADGYVTKRQFKSHTKWVSSLHWHPRKTHLFASASHDGTVKLWDVRSEIPLHTLTPAHTSKVLSVRWGEEDDLWSGGADNIVRKYHATF